VGGDSVNNHREHREVNDVVQTSPSSWAASAATDRAAVCPLRRRRLQERGHQATLVDPVEYSLCLCWTVCTRST